MKPFSLETGHPPRSDRQEGSGEEVATLGSARGDMLGRFIANRSLFAWLALCLGATICAFIILDLPAELQAWDYLSASGVPTWAIFLGLAIGWTRNSTFWSWLLIVGVAAIWFRESMKKNQKDKQTAGLKLKSEVTMTKHFSIWKLVLAMLPAAGFYNGAYPYGYVDGVYQKLPFSLWGALGGLFAGLVISGILYAIGLGLTRLLNIIRSRTSAKSLKE